MTLQLSLFDSYPVVGVRWSGTFEREPYETRVHFVYSPVADDHRTVCGRRYPDDAIILATFPFDQVCERCRSARRKAKGLKPQSRRTRATARRRAGGTTGGGHR